MGVGGDRTTAVWQFPIYTSATLTASGNSGVVSLPAYLLTGPFYPSWFTLEGQNIATDETLALVMDLFPSSAYQALTAAQSLGTITFTTLTASLLGVKEEYPGDIGISKFMGALPMPQNFLLAWTLAGTTKSMNFILYANGVILL